MKIPSFRKSSLFPFSNKPQIGAEEIKHLLDLLPDAALFVDVETELIVQANVKASKLTTFTNAELVNRALNELFPIFPRLWLRNIKNSLPYKTLMTTRNQSAQQVAIHAIHLGHLSQHVLLTIASTAAQQQQKIEHQLQAQRLDVLNELVQAAYHIHFEQALQRALQAGRRLTDSKMLGVYHISGSSPELVQIAYECDVHLPNVEKMFPRQLPLSELANLRKPYLWEPGKRTLSQFHRQARAANLAYFASAPLGIPQALTGLLVMAAPDTPAPKDILSLTHVTAATLTTIIEHHSQTTHLSEQVRQQATALATKHTVQSNTKESIILVTHDFAILELNPAAEITLGYATNEVRGQPVENILVGAETLAPALLRAREGVPTHDLGNMTLHRRNGQAFPAHIRTIPSQSRKPVDVVVILFQDLSEREGLRLRTQQLEQRALLGEVTAIFAHEVRNPINNISTGLQLMALDLPENDPTHTQIKRMQQDCDRLSHLMKSVLSFARPQEYKMAELDLGQLLQRLLDRWRPRFASANVRARLQASAAIPKACGNSRALDQVFTNLISNAVQAMSENGGQLMVKIEPKKTHGMPENILVSISDTGPGIPEEVLEQIFKPFYTTNQLGTGLGLAIAKRIITAHKGSLKVNSFPGGTVFRVHLPAVPTTDTPSPENTP